MRSLTLQRRSLDESIGFVPTMGALHQGHLSLVTQAKQQSSFVICSIFVNPAQFNNTDDLKNYPRNEETDFQMLTSVGCDIVFAPDAKELNLDVKGHIHMNFGTLESTMEGAFRPGHFAGVGLVVSKLFNIVQPDFAFFGTKDLQQLAVIKKLVADLNFPLEIIPVETIREKSGLAMSSRNLLFSSDEKLDASVIIQVLQDFRAQLLEGKDLLKSKEDAIKKLSSYNFIETEYLEVVLTDSLEIINEWNNSINTSICCAAMVHGVRLIDNIKI